jgi:hypothetical protein
MPLKLLLDFVLTDMKRTNPRYIMILFIVASIWANFYFATKKDVQAIHDDVAEVKQMLKSAADSRDELRSEVHEMRADLRAHMNASHSDTYANRPVKSPAS